MSVSTYCRNLHTFMIGKSAFPCDPSYDQATLDARDDDRDRDRPEDDEARRDYREELKGDILRDENLD